MAGDPLLPAVAWTWLTDGLDQHGAAYVAIGGTITQTASTRFGELAGPAPTADLEIRASWTPRSPDLGAHLRGWCAMLASTAGLPPPGVTALTDRHRASTGCAPPRRYRESEATADRSAALADRSAALADRSAALADRSAALADREGLAGRLDRDGQADALGVLGLRRREADHLLVGVHDGTTGVARVDRRIELDRRAVGVV